MVVMKLEVWIWDQIQYEKIDLFLDRHALRFGEIGHKLRSTTMVNGSLQPFLTITMRTERRYIGKILNDLFCNSGISLKNLNIYEIGDGKNARKIE